MTEIYYDEFYLFIYLFILGIESKASFLISICSTTDERSSQQLDFIIFLIDFPRDFDLNEKATT
jgi:hypothetical protein